MEIGKKSCKMPKMTELILASKSPWRKRLLKKHGIDCKIHVSKFTEAKKHSTPGKLALSNACGKAESVAKLYKNAIVIGVDTIVVLGKKIIGKPRNKRHSREMLKSLSGKTHRVISGLCVINTYTNKKTTSAVTTKLTFRKIERDELEKYLNSGQWKGKAGSYAIQGRAKKFVKKIDGDITNVVGLPIDELRRMLATTKACAIPPIC